MSERLMSFYAADPSEVPYRKQLWTKLENSKSTKRPSSKDYADSILFSHLLQDDDLFEESIERIVAQWSDKKTTDLRFSHHHNVGEIERSIWTWPLGKSERSLQHSLEEKFSQLVTKWREEVMFSSDPSEIVMNMNYLRIIALGENAVPLIKGALAEACEHWFVALEAITGHSPSPPAGGFSPSSLREYWLEWLSRNR